VHTLTCSVWSATRNFLTKPCAPKGRCVVVCCSVLQYCSVLYRRACKFHCRKKPLFHTVSMRTLTRCFLFQIYLLLKTPTHPLTHPHPCIRTHTHTHTYTHTHTHTHTLFLFLSHTHTHIHRRLMTWMILVGFGRERSTQILSANLRVLTRCVCGCGSVGFRVGFRV